MKTNLKTLRKSRKITQMEFAKILNISCSTYKSYENDYSEMSYDILIKVANFYNTSIDAILNRKFDSFDLTKLTSYQSTLLSKISNLTDKECERVSDFISGMKH